jgi:hypothetical protein
LRHGHRLVGDYFKVHNAKKSKIWSLTAKAGGSFVLIEFVVVMMMMMLN